MKSSAEMRRSMKKVLQLIKLTVISCLLFSLVACGSQEVISDNTAQSLDNQETEEEDKETKQQDSSLQDILTNGKLVVGLDASFPPMGFRDDDQNIIGFDIDVAKEVCKRMGIELELVPINWDAKEQELNTKNIDCIWNGMSYNDEREESMQLSQPYMKNTQVIVVLKESSAETLEDLTGKTVALQNGSTASDAMNNNKEFSESVSIVKIDNNVQALMDLKVSGSDAVAIDEVVARYYMEKEPDTFKILEETLSEEEYVIGFRKGEMALCGEIEKQLKEMAADGTLAEISTTWFGKDITSIK